MWRDPGDRCAAGCARAETVTLGWSSKSDITSSRLESMLLRSFDTASLAQPPPLGQIREDFSHLIAPLRTRPRSQLKPTGSLAKDGQVKGL